jgi:hypothetical protein
MLLIKMIETSRIKYPMNPWDKASIRPGPVGSVGDVLTSVRIKQSMPEMPFAYDKTFGPSSDMLRGSNVQDGRWESYVDGGYGAVTKKQRWSNNYTGFKTATGWIAQNIIPEQRATDPKVGSQPRQGFETQAAAILNRQGDMFGELPGGYKAPAGVLPRGGMLPRTVNPESVPKEVPGKDKWIKWDVPVERMKPLPTAGGLLQSLVTNLTTPQKLPTPSNNLNGRRDKDIDQWMSGFGTEVVGKKATSDMDVDKSAIGSKIAQEHQKKRAQAIARGDLGMADLHDKLSWIGKASQVGLL